MARSGDAPETRVTERRTEKQIFLIIQITGLTHIYRIENNTFISMRLIPYRLTSLTFISMKVIPTSGRALWLGPVSGWRGHLRVGQNFYLKGSIPGTQFHNPF